VAQLGGSGPLADPAVLGVLAAAPFLLLSTRDAGGSADTSPRGDRPGFVRVLDGRTLAVPDRRGNRRADTLHNLLADPRISAAALVPGRADVLHLSGTAAVTDDPALLAGMALGGKPPQTALLIDVGTADIRRNDALVAANLWDRTAHVDRTTLPDLMALGAEHLGTKARAVRLLMKPLAAFPALTRRLVDLGYRRQLRREGYGGSGEDGHG
jgi:predicted pyridoxine 5'-phosphate oxidase superfamily flavin-nucleotide-binding protein